ncbi:uncharacterized protein LOC119922494 [Tachyglossus aculeatus]|uniref:uncharacterized protein LOC119922494 n=1 Tax=Tachyglossus aculeatus TaxID=9261 RepID=UPI0018F7862B|nr:uncharacterized protein LOC119922494 [Tachyglossus aculeatus]
MCACSVRAAAGGAASRHPRMLSLGRAGRPPEVCACSVRAGAEGAMSKHPRGEPRLRSDSVHLPINPVSVGGTSQNPRSLRHEQLTCSLDTQTLDTLPSSTLEESASLAGRQPCLEQPQRSEMLGNGILWWPQIPREQDLQAPAHTLPSSGPWPLTPPLSWMQYMLSMVVAYFIRAARPTWQYKQFHFFLALYLANDIEQDMFVMKKAMLPFAFGHKVRAKEGSIFYRLLLKFFEAIGGEARVSPEECEEVMARDPFYWAWCRDRIVCSMPVSWWNEDNRVGYAVND